MVSDHVTVMWLSHDSSLLQSWCPGFPAKVGEGGTPEKRWCGQPILSPEICEL